MCRRVSTAGIPLSDHHGLVDIGPRRFEPDEDLELFGMQQAPSAPIREQTTSTLTTRRPGTKCRTEI